MNKTVKQIKKVEGDFFSKTSGTNNIKHED